MLVLDVILVASVACLVAFGYALRRVLSSLGGSRAAEVISASSVAGASVIVCAAAMGPSIGLVDLAAAEAMTLWDLEIALSVPFVLPLAVFTLAVAWSLERPGCRDGCVGRRSASFRSC